MNRPNAESRDPDSPHPDQDQDAVTRPVTPEDPDEATIAVDVPTVAGSSPPPTSATSPTPAAALPQRVGDYPIEAELGRGGMGVVYRAVDPRLGRAVALKVLPAGMADDPEWLAGFEREARLLAALNHPNIATIHSLEETDGGRFLTMELIEGENLSERIADGPLAYDETLDLCRQIARALEAAHKQDVIHLDIKPGNVRITPGGHAKVLDFGLARATGDAHATPDSTADGSDSRSGQVFGSPGYMSPEQLRAQAIDHRADIWALGAILYECLTGRRAFGGGSVREILTATLESDPDWEALPEKTPARLRDVLTRCLAKRTPDRIAGIAELRHVIEEEITARSLAYLQAAREEPAETSPNNLPVQVSSFVGRVGERARILELMRDTRLLALTGMGGCGKTRLALEVARDLLDDFPGGAWLVELAPLNQPELLPQTLATVLGVKEEPHRDLVQTLVDHLANRKTLLIFDNCEHLLDACAALAGTLLRSCAELKLLASSREALGIEGEVKFHIPSLALPEPGRTLSPVELAEVESVRLFVERARAVKPDFKLNEENAAATVEICRRLDGIPLAIELAVARVRSMSVQEIADRLDNRFRLLKSGNRTALPRHKTLQALIDWSYESLDGSEQTLLRRLAVFAGGWTLDAAEAVCADEDLDEWEVLDFLTNLVDKSLVEIDVAGGERIGKTRFRMLETVRHYAGERLREQDDEQAARERHRDFFLQTAGEAEQQLVGAEQATWLERLEAEHDNLRAAIETCRAANNTQTFLRLIGALGRFWEVRGHWSEGRLVCASLPTAGEVEEPADLAKVLVFTGNFALHQGDYEPARTSYEQALSIFRDCDDRHGTAQALNNLGLIAWNQDRPDDALAYHTEGLETRRVLGDRRGVAVSLNNLALIAWFRRDFEQARARHEESLAIKRELGDQRGIAASLSNLGFVALEQGDHPEARRLHEESLSIRRELGDRRGIAVSLHNLGSIAEQLGDLDTAASHYNESLGIKRELGDRHGTALTLGRLASVVEQQGNLDAARAPLEQSLEIQREIGDTQGIASSLLQLGNVVGGQGAEDQAMALLKESLELRVKLGDRAGIAATLESFGNLALRRGEAERAARLLGAAAGVREAAASQLLESDRARIQGYEVSLRTALGEGTFEAARLAGGELTCDEAVTYALET